MPRPARPPTRFARRAAVGCAVVGLALAGGCQGLSKKKTNGTSPSAPPPSSDPFWNDTRPPGRSGTPTASVPSAGVTPASGNDSDQTGLLAGRVMDPQRQMPGVVFVQVQPTDGGPPLEVETNSQGQFVVRGLSPVRSYRLVARTKRDGRLLAGEVVARPPDARLVIALGEELASSNTPPLPDPSRRGAPAASAPSPAAELGTPRNNGDYFPPPDQVAGNDFASTPRANIPAPGLPNTGPNAQTEWTRVNGPVPECLVANGRVLSLRLRDPEGAVWDLSQREGRLVLIDLWGSWCGPCLRAIPDLVRLQSQYRTKGLEVIGIACEQGQPDDNLRRVKKARQMIGNLNYRLLVAGEPGRDPVRAQFRPSGFPALYLLDSDGTIVWKGVGTDVLPELEGVIRSRLDGR